MTQKWWVLAAVACGTFMATLDSSIVNIALPTLTKELGSDLARVKWVVIVYLFVISSLLLPFGRLSDIYGRKRTFAMGFVVFTVGSVFCGFAPDLVWLVVCRMLQGAGAAMLMANGPAIITASFPSSERGTALGTMAMVVSAGLVSGPSIGGYLITHMGWRSIFLVNFPVGLLGVLLVYKFVRSDVIPQTKPVFDWIGAVLQSIVIILLMLVIDPPSVSVSGGQAFVVSRVVVGLLALVFLFMFIRIQAMVRAPLFDLSLLKIRTFWTANLASFLTFVAYSAVSVLTPFFLEVVLGKSPDNAGLFMTAIPLTIFVVAPISGRLSDRFGSQGLSFAGALVGSLAMFAMAGAFGMGLHSAISPSGIILGLCAVGLGTALFQSPNNNAIMSAVPPHKLGVASALLATVRNLGLVTGTGLATGIFSWRLQTGGDFVSALHFTYSIAGFVGVGATLAALGKGSGKNSAPMVEAIEPDASRPVSTDQRELPSK